MTETLLSSASKEVRMGADVMMGNDPDCRQWISKYREPGAGGERRGRGIRRRRREATNEQ